MLAHPILFVLVLAAPASEALGDEDPRPPVAPLPEDSPLSEDTNRSFFSRSPKPTPLLPERVRSTAIYFVGGLGAPVASGLEAVRRIGQWFELTGAVGVGYSASDSDHTAGIGHALQWAVMPRLRLGNDHDATIVGAGISAGNYGGLNFCLEAPCTNNPYPVSYFLWSNVEIGKEYWSSGGFAARFFAGLAHGWCVSNPCVPATPTTFPYFGLGLGYAF